MKGFDFLFKPPPISFERFSVFGYCIRTLAVNCIADFLNLFFINYYYYYYLFIFKFCKQDKIKLGDKRNWYVIEKGRPNWLGYRWATASFANGTGLCVCV